MNRRAFVLLGTTGILAISFPLSCSKINKVKYDPLLAQPQSLSALLDYEKITTIGNKYLAKTSDETDVGSLVKLIMHGISDNKAKLAEALETKIKTDFEKRNTVMVDGWVLSVTEARQCAMSSLTNLT
jgi:hypothetical protein